MDYGLDIMEVLRRAAKYLVEGGAVALAAYLVPKSKLALGEILVLALTAASVFAILDLYSPSVASSSRVGSGLTIGASLLGGIPIA